MIEIIVGIILAPIALCAAALTLALGVGVCQGFIQIFKKK
jgi:hypothetical protein